MAQRDIFASTTGNDVYGLFFDPRTMDLFNDYNTELLEIVSKQHMKYWGVERDLSDPNDIYGESDTKITRNPVDFYAWILLEEPVTQTNNYTTDVKRRIEVYAHKDRLTEIGVVPQIGDYLEWDNQFFEIVSSDVPRFVFGIPDTKLGVILRAISVREDVFSGNRDPEIDETESDLENPF